MARDLAVRPNAPIAQAAAQVCPYEALRVLALRLAGRDLSTIGVFRVTVCEARGKPGWTVVLGVPGAILTRPSSDTDMALGLRIKSDVGALELAGLSLSIPRSKNWHAPAVFVRKANRETWEADAPSPDAALFDLRRTFAREIEARIREDVMELKRRGIDFDVGAGWGATVRHEDPTIITVEAEIVEETPPRLPR